MLKNYLSVLLLSCWIAAFGSEKKVDEFSFYPAPYLRFWENNFKNYWRYENFGKDKNDGTEFSAVTNEFKNKLGILLGFLQMSGIYDIEKISGKSIEFKKSGDDIHFKNKITIEYDDESKGFLKALFSELPKEKIPALSDKEEEINDLFLIKNNTLCAFELPFNFNAVMQTSFKDSALAGTLNNVSKKIMKMPLAELADNLTGVWGGLVNINRNSDAENKSKTIPDFIFIIPDPEQKIFRQLGEYLVMNRLAFYKDKMLHVRIASMLKFIAVSSDSFCIVASSPESLLKLSEVAKKKEIDPLLKKLDVER